jgi:hypothetical protein
MPTTGGAVKRKAPRKKPAARKGKKPAARKTASKSKYSEMTVVELRKKIARYNKKHPTAKIKTTKKVKKGNTVTYKPLGKRSLVAKAKAKRV